MADRRLAIEITVEGDAKSVFKEIGAAAKQSAKDVTDSGQRAQQGIERIEKAADAAEKEVKELGQTQERVAKSAEALEKAQAEAAKATKEMAEHSAKAKSSLAQYRQAISEASQGMALLGTAFTLYARQARDHEITVMAIQRMYGEAADSYISFADTIQNTTIFSNDEALEAARIMGTLRENYDLTDQQIQQLIQTSADLAAMHGFTLTDAAMRVQSAIRGEAESAEMLGLTMNQAAIDTQGLTLTMSNAEAAQFRFNAMMKQSASSVGFAAKATEDMAGKTQQLANRFQDAMLDVVRFTGPVGQAAGALSRFGLEAGIAATGLIRLGQGLAALRGTAAIASLVAMGPALLVGGGVVAALGLAAYGAYDVYKALTDVEEVASSSQMAIDALAQSYTDLGESAASAATLMTAQTFHAQITSGFDQLLADIGLFQTTWEQINSGQVAPSMLQTQMLVLDELMIRFGDSAEEAGYKISNMQFDMADIIASGNVQAIREASAAWNEFKASAQTYDDLLKLHDTINTIDESLADYEYAANLAATANNNIASSSTSAATAIQNQAGVQREANAQLQAWLELHGLSNQYNEAQAFAAQNASVEREMANLSNRLNWQRLYGDAVDEGTFALNLFSNAGKESAERLRANVLGVQSLEKAYDDLFPVVEQSARAVQDLGDELNQLSADTKSADMSRIADEFEAAMRAASGLGDTIYDLKARGGTVGLDLAINTGGAQQALQSGLGSIVGGTNALGQASSQVADFSASLAHGNLMMTKLDNLFLDGAISATTYRKALEANHRIQMANESVQEDVLRIQVKQLPVLAQLAEEQARYVDELADADVATQTVALGYMDQAKAAQAMSLAQLAASASMAGMEGAAGDMILRMAEADPILKAMLIDMGLLSETKGKLNVEFGEVEDADKAINNLNKTLETLTAVIATAFGIDVTLDDGGAANRLAAILHTLNMIDGKSVTAYVNTVGMSSADLAATGTYVYPESARNLVAKVDAMATGGHLTLVGEAGPELVQLPTGSTVTNAAGTRGRLDPQGRGRRSAGGGVTYKGNIINQTITYDESAMSRRADRLSRNRR
jgi:hypothetical protein